MSRDYYDSITIGTSIDEVVAEAGDPRLIHPKNSNILEYEYIERISIQRRPDHFSVENKYFIDVIDGTVVGKHMTTSRSPAYNVLYETIPNYAAP